MQIPFLDLKAQYKSIQEEIDKKILDVVSSQQFILGEEVGNLEREIAEYCRAKFAVGVSSGSDALIVSLMAFEVGEGDYVVTTPFSFFSTAGAIARLKATPIFCDIEEKSFNLDPEKLKELLKDKIARRDESRIRAIIPVHLYGQVADMDRIMILAKEYNLFILEDAAQAVGADYPQNGGSKKAGTLGDAGILSFFPSKNLGGFGDGGMVLTDDTDMETKLKLLRVHGSENKYFYKILGGNFRLDAIQAAVLRVKLKYLDKWMLKRREKAAYYHRLFSESGLIDSGLVRIPFEIYKNKGIENHHTYHQYVIRVAERKGLREFLEGKGIPTAIYYPLGLHLQKCFTYLGYKEGDFPVTERISSEVLALPIYPEISTEQQQYVVHGIQEFY